MRPCAVGHPVVNDHAGLTGVVFLKKLTVEQAFLGKGAAVAVAAAALGKLAVRIDGLGVFLQIVHHRVAHRIAEGGFLTPEDALGQPVPLKSLAQQVLALAVGVQLLFGVDGHDILDKIQITERHAGLQTIDADRAVGAQDIVHIQLPDALLALGLESGSARRIVGVLVAEQLIGDFAGQQHPDVGMLMDVFADKVHTHRSADRCDVPSAQHRNDILERAQHDLPVDDDLGVVSVEIVGHLLGVFQVDGVLAHADGKGTDRLAEFFGGNGADQTGIQPARQQESDGGVSVKALIDTGHKLFPDVRQNFGQLILRIGRGVGNIAVPHKLTVAVVAADRERIDLFAQSHKVFRLGRKGNVPALAVAVEQRTDADGVTRGDKQLFAAVVEDHCKLGVQMPEHSKAVLIVERQDNLAVGVRRKGVALGLQLGLDRAEAVQLAVAGHAVRAAGEGLHSLRRQAHDGQTAEAQQSELGLDDALVVRTAAGGAQQILGKGFLGQIMPGIAHDTAHFR